MRDGKETSVDGAEIVSIKDLNLPATDYEVLHTGLASQDFEYRYPVNRFVRFIGLRHPNPDLSGDATFIFSAVSPIAL